MLEGIPNSFECFGKTIKVVWLNEIVSEEDGSELWGQCDFTGNNIELCKPGPGIDPENLRQVFWHECVHMFCHLLSRPDLANDETFVDLMGAAIHQSLRSAKYPRVRTRGRAIARKPRR